MKRLYAPWRRNYVTGVTGKSKKKELTEHECVFCQQFLAKDDDDASYIIKRFSHCVVMMNLYPYNVGHIMVLPYQHLKNLSDLEPIVRAQMMEVVNLATIIIGKVMSTEGFNIGINLGIAGGGGIPSHLHIHVLPRWSGDTNFLETIGGTKLISVDFEKTFKDLKEAFSLVNLT